MEITIEFDNVHARVFGATDIQIQLLNKMLTVKDKGYYFNPAYQAGRWDGTVRFLTTPDNIFPTGLLPRVVELFQELDCNVILKDKRLEKDNYVIDVVKPNFRVSELKESRDYQVETINLVANNKILDIPFYRGIINIATNGGKTVIAESIIKNLYEQLVNSQKIFLFVTHSKEIGYQTQRSIERDLHIPVGFIGDGQWNVEPVTIAMPPTLYKRMNSGREEFKQLKKDVVGFIADECHHAASDSFYKVFNNLPSAVIRLGLTGTVDKTNPVNVMKLYSCMGPIIKKISNDFLIQRGVSAKPVCLMFKIRNPELEDMDYTDAYNWGIVNNAFRHEVIYDICEKETKSNNKVLILVERIDHGEQLRDMLLPMGKEVYFTNGQLGSAERESLLNKLRYGELDILIASNILDEGVDVSGINALIYARGMRSMRKLLQGIGRGLRAKEGENVLRFYDFIDDTNIKLLKHSQERYITLEKEHFVIKLMTLANYHRMSWEEIMKT